MLTPEMVHYGRAEQVIAARRLVREEAFRSHPERFVNKQPEPLQLPAAVWINPPANPGEIQPIATLNSIVQLSQKC